MNELSHLTRRHYERNEADASLVSKVTRILDSLPDGSVDSSQLAGLDQFHIMGLEATKQLAQIAGIGSGATVLDAGSGLGGPSRYLASTYGCRVVGVDLSASFIADFIQALMLFTELTAMRGGNRYGKTIWGRPNSRVTSRQFDHNSASRAFMSRSNRPYGFTCSQISGVSAA